MSRQNNEPNGFLETVVTYALGLFITGFLLAVPAVLLAMFYFLRRPISRALDLERRAASWFAMQWCIRPLKWLAAFLFVVLLVNAAHYLTVTPVLVDQIIVGLFCLCGGLAFALLFNVLHWLVQYTEEPAVRKIAAGMAAERYVQSLIEACQQHFPGSRSLHGKLFVFNAHTPAEFSVEADHILITERNIYVIETKCKSGTISAGADLAKWPVSSSYGTGDMQNALKQAKNAARVLQRQTGLPCEVIPLVAIKGNEVRIVDGPTNVVVAEHLAEVLHAFENSKPRSLLDPVAVTSLLLPHICEDKAAMERHIERAQAARIRAERDEIVSAASIR